MPGLRGAFVSSERNHSRCGVCRVKRNVRKAQKRGDNPAAVAALFEKVRDAKLERFRVLGYDDGAGSREAVRRRRAA